MGRRARHRKEAEELAQHVTERQIIPQLTADQLRKEGMDVEVAFVSTAADA